MSRTYAKRTGNRDLNLGAVDELPLNLVLLRKS